MYRIFVIALMAVGLFCTDGWGGLTPEQEKRLEQLESQEQMGRVISQDMLEFNKSFSENSPGRFQAVRLSNVAVMILDTQACHIWLWLAKGETFLLIYEGQVFPGTKMGEIIDSYQMRKARTNP